MFFSPKFEQLKSESCMDSWSKHNSRQETHFWTPVNSLFFYQQTLNPSSTHNARYCFLSVCLSLSVSVHIFFGLSPSDLSSRHTDSQRFKINTNQYIEPTAAVVRMLSYVHLQTALQSPHHFFLILALFFYFSFITILTKNSNYCDELLSKMLNLFSKIIHTVDKLSNTQLLLTSHAVIPVLLTNQSAGFVINLLARQPKSGIKPTTHNVYDHCPSCLASNDIIC